MISSSLHGKRGFALVFVIVLLMAVSTVGVGFALKAGMSGVIAANQVGGAQALYAAEAGLSDAKWNLRSSGTWRTGFTDKSFGPGSYTVTLADVSTSWSDPYHGSVRITSVGTVNGIEREVVDYVYPHTPSLSYAVFTNGSFINWGGAQINGDTYQGTGIAIPNADWSYLQANATWPNEGDCDPPGECKTPITWSDQVVEENIYVDGFFKVNKPNVTIKGYVVVNTSLYYGPYGGIEVTRNNFRVIAPAGHPALIARRNIVIDSDDCQIHGFVGAGGNISVEEDRFKVWGGLVALGNITVDWWASNCEFTHSPYNIRISNGIQHASGSLTVTPAELAWRQVFE